MANITTGYVDHGFFLSLTIRQHEILLKNEDDT
jgi:hypothetical protein